MSTDRVRDLALRDGMSVLVGTVDRAGVPACCRAVALQSDDDLATLTVYVPVATSRDVIANVASTKRVAVSTSHPIENVSFQMKGSVREVRLARDDEASFIEYRLGKFAEVLAEIGLPRRITRSVNHSPAFAIEVAVEQIFDQTPGPKAGVAIQ
ncbi:MAG TPA: hypothetical protein VEZ11_02490 [Thermoanaerobaculia bacterium]|nr:hypothetical protein [Thermoanaerobaculia bacterium]